MHDSYLLVGEDRIRLYTNILNLDIRKLSKSHLYILYIYIYMYVYMYTNSGRYIYIYVCVYIYICMYIYIYLYIYICIYIYVYIYMYKYIYICIYICVCVCVYMYVYIYMYVSRGFKPFPFFCAIISLCFCGRDILRLRAEAKTTRASAAPSELPCRLSRARLRLLYRKGVRIYAHIYVISILHTLYNMSNIPLYVYVCTSIVFYLYHVNIFSCIL